MSDPLFDEDDEANTPLEAEERDGLIPSYITLHRELTKRTRPAFQPPQYSCYFVRSFSIAPMAVTMYSSENTGNDVVPVNTRSGTGK
jgi:hypothetical protein